MANWLKTTLWIIAGLVGIALLVLMVLFAIATAKQVFPRTKQEVVVVEITRVVEVQVERVVEVEKEVEKVVEVTKIVTLEPTAEPTKPEASAISGDEAHWARLEALDPTFRSGGLESWLKQAGVTWSSLEADARQVEEETSPDSKILASGIQVDGKDIVISYPVIVTTDDPSRITVADNTRQHKPDERNPSVLYTNVILNGIGTIWIDGSNWGQLTP